MVKLLREEWLAVTPECIKEEGTDRIKSHYLCGTFMQTETLNRNGRIYPRPILEREMQRYQHTIDNKRALGELGHPDTPTINLDRVSHLITDLHFEGNNIVGRAKILETPNGKIVKNFIDEGIILGMSSRAMGSVKSVNGANVVQEDLKLATVDIVSEPSAPEAWVNGIMENKEWVLFNGVWTEMHLEQAQQQIKQASARDIDDVALLIWSNFLNNLNA